MNSRKAALLLIFFYCALSCTESEQELSLRPFARVETTGVSNITSDGVLLSGRITFATVGIDDHGFLLSANPTFPDGVTLKFSFGPRTGTGSFEQRVETQLEEGRKYFAKSYAKSKAYTSFGKVEEFVSLGSKAPALTSFEPQIGIWGDKVTIRGANFAVSTGATEVFFEDAKAEIVSIGLDSIVCRVPNSLRVSPAAVKVVVLKNAVQFTQRFSLHTPEITSISPSEARFDERITVNGKYFGSGALKVMLGDKELTVSAPTAEQFKFDVPWGLGEGEIELRVYNAEGNGFGRTTIQSFPVGVGAITPLNGTYDQIVELELINWPLSLTPSVKFGTTTTANLAHTTTKLTVAVPPHLPAYQNMIEVSAGPNSITTGKIFVLDPPAVEAVSARMFFVDDVMTITGERFSQYHTEVKLGERQLPFTVYSNNEIEAHVQIGERHQEKLTVTCSGQVSPDAFVMNFPFCRVNSNIALTHVHVTIPYSDGAFFIHDASNSVRLSWRNRLTRDWVDHGPVPATFDSNDFGFVANGKLYVVSAYYGTLWAYDLTSKTWIQRENVPFVRQKSQTFSVNDYAYIVGGYDEDGWLSNAVWQYNTLNDTWSNKTSSPDATQNGVYANGRYYGLTDDGKIAAYDPGADEWTLTPSGVVSGWGAILSYRSGFLYIDDKSYFQLARYNLSTGEKKMYNLPYLHINEPVPMGASAIFFDESWSLMEFDPAYLLP